MNCSITDFGAIGDGKTLNTAAIQAAIDCCTAAGGDPALRELLSLEHRVTNHMPPTFLWHCVGDESVPVENSLLLASAMQRAGVPYECHLFAGGAHGISMCNQEVETPYPAASAWIGLCQTWLNQQFNYTP